MEINVTIKPEFDKALALAASAFKIAGEFEYLADETNLDRMFGCFDTLMRGEYPIDTIESMAEYLNSFDNCIAFNQNLREINKYLTEYHS